MMASMPLLWATPQHTNISFHFNLKLYSQVTFKLPLTMALLKDLKISKNTESEQKRMQSTWLPKIFYTLNFVQKILNTK